MAGNHALRHVVQMLLFATADSKRNGDGFDRVDRNIATPPGRAGIPGGDSAGLGL